MKIINHAVSVIKPINHSTALVERSILVLYACLVDCRILRHCQLLPVACWCAGYKDASLLLTGTTTASQFLPLTLVFVIHLSQYTDGKR